MHESPPVRAFFMARRVGVVKRAPQARSAGDQYPFDINQTSLQGHGF
jgi:hypothetical protein